MVNSPSGCRMTGRDAPSVRGGIRVKIAIGSDERTHLTDLLVEELTRRGHEVLPFGPLAPGDAEVDWPLVSSNVARAVAAGVADEVIVCCWTGTAAASAANHTPGIRTAL